VDFSGEIITAEVGYSIVKPIFYATMTQPPQRVLLLIGGSYFLSWNKERKLLGGIRWMAKKEPLFSYQWRKPPQVAQ
jgi:hypothetical protein